MSNFGEAQALILLTELAADTPVLGGVLETTALGDDGPTTINWELLERRYPMLSSGEQRIVDFVASLTGRRHVGSQSTLHEILTGIDGKWQRLVTIAFGAACSEYIR